MTINFLVQDGFCSYYPSLEMNSSHLPVSETFCNSVRPLSFEKDDDTNDHICFISAASVSRVSVDVVSTENAAL